MQYPQFKHISFDQPDAARAFLGQILAATPALAAPLAKALSGLTEPDKIVIRLQRVLEADAPQGAHAQLMQDRPAFARFLCEILSHSPFMGEIMCRFPAYVRDIWSSDGLRAARSAAELADHLWGDLEPLNRKEDYYRVLRLFHQREMFRIGARDLYMHAEVASVTRDLSNLADAALECAYRCMGRALEERFGTPQFVDSEGTLQPSAFVVLAMGKLGGRELNFSSDIDLIFVYEEDGDTSGGRSGSTSNTEYYHKLGEGIIKAITELTENGCVFRVDMRLRPHGRMGPLACSLSTAIAYYEDYGRGWERQALIKTRPSAGNLALGERFIEDARPFVFPRYFDDGTLEDIRETKQRLEEQVRRQGDDHLQVKLGPGGIRDIEFTVQILQLLHGGETPELRTRNTLEAIALLGEHGLLGLFEARELTKNYAFLRTVEHRIQIESAQQRHHLPADPAAFDAFAQRNGFESGEAFREAYQTVTAENRRILERFLAVQGSGTLWVSRMLDFSGNKEYAITRLREHGFKEPEKAQEEVYLLHAGPPEHPHTSHVQRLFVAVLPRLLEALSDCYDADGTLRRLTRILLGLKAPAAIYDVLNSRPDLCGLLTRLLSNSQYLAEIMIRDPGLFDTLGYGDTLKRIPTREALEELLQSLLKAHDRDAALYRLRDGEILRVGIREVLGHINVVEVGHELTQLAEVSLSEALRQGHERAADRFGSCGCALAVLGVGKIGGREMGYGSDLDLLFVYNHAGVDQCPTAPEAYFATAVTHAIGVLKERTRYGMLYDIDARLRPYGGQGALVISDKQLLEYYATDAHPWERLALVKVRAVGGDPEFAHRLEAAISAVPFERPFTQEERDNIEAIRAKLAAKASPLDIKHYEGGLAELEFSIRLLQLHHANEYPELRRGDVLGALDVLAQKKLLSPPEFGAIAKAYIEYRMIENRLRMMLGASDSTLPESESERTDLAVRLGLSGNIVELVNAHRAVVRALYHRAASLST